MKRILIIILLITAIIGLSLASVKISEKKSQAKQLIINQNNSINEFAKANSLPSRLLKEAFGLKNKEDL
ncbi:MAG: hypothetical protein JEZ07_09520 [Phycisphaerae bacterium]|nr:hypothetical protein [Phycisphaerae bacterium]